MKDELVVLIDEMITSLKNVGKQATADYFLSLKTDILKTDSNVKLRTILKRLMSSGSITQYANFDHKQDVIFENIYDIAEKLYNSL